MEANGQPFPTSGAPAERRSCAWCGVRNHWHRPLSVSGDDGGPGQLEQLEAEPGPVTDIRGGGGDDAGVSGNDSGFAWQDPRGSGADADRMLSPGGAKPFPHQRQLLGGGTVAQQRPGPRASPQRPMSDRPNGSGGDGEKSTEATTSAVPGYRILVRQDSDSGAGRATGASFATPPPPRTALAPGWGRDPRHTGDGAQGAPGDLWTWRSLLA